ncbi:hypothetical protein BDW22DRAFT_79777 [Trametopsis cervina]|nr:hypothetical protein BDW22DRAFT_79777 [Trametopsis cervina]
MGVYCSPSHVATILVCLQFSNSHCLSLLEALRRRHSANEKTICMLGHAHRRVDHLFVSVLQVAASRAWVRTRPVHTRAVHRTNDAQHNVRAVINVAAGEGSSTSVLLHNDIAPSVAGTTSGCEQDEAWRVPPTTQAGLSQPLVSLVQPTTGAHRGGLLRVGPSHSASASTPASFETNYRMHKPPLATDLVVNEAAERLVMRNNITGQDNTSIRDTHSSINSAGQTEPGQGDDWDAALSKPSRQYGVPFPSTEPPGGELQRSSETLSALSSPVSLYHNLIRLSAAPSSSSAHRTHKLHELLEYHHRHPEFHSTSSYNLLISLALAIQEFTIAEMLFKEMDRCRIPGDFETRKLSVRFWVRQGQWSQAWMRETAGGREPLPLLIWIEFFEGMKIFERSSRSVPSAERAAHRDNCAKAVRSRHTLLLRHRPALTAFATASFPPRAAYYLIRWLLSGGEQQEAHKLTVAYFKSLPRILRPAHRKRLTDIMNLHLQAEAKTTRELRPTLKKMLTLHPALRPDVDTLRIILRAMRTHTGNSILLDRVRRQFQARWGEDIVDERILFFIADRAFRDRFPRLLKKIIQEYEHRRDTCAPLAWLPEPAEPDERRSHRVVYYDLEGENRRWDHQRESLRILLSRQTQLRSKKSNSKLPKPACDETAPSQTRTASVSSPP